MGDIIVRATAGPAPNIDWTVAVEFVNQKTWVPPAPVRRSLVPRYYKYEDWPEPEATGGLKYGQIITLTQIVKTANEQKVPTLSKQEYFLQFCPDRGTGDRWVTFLFVQGRGGKRRLAKILSAQGKGIGRRRLAILFARKRGGKRSPPKFSFAQGKGGKNECWSVA